MARTLADLWPEVVAAFAQGRWDQALRRCIVILQGAPACFEARMKVGDILLKQGMVAEAMEVYRVVAWHFTKAGFPLLGVVAVKMLSAVEQGYADVLEVLASLYAAGSDRVSERASAPKLPDLQGLEMTALGQNIDTVVPLSGAELGKLAATLAKDERGLQNYPAQLPAIPLLGQLPEAAFTAVLRDLQLRRFVEGTTVLREGDAGDSFFILARGTVEVTKQVGGERLLLAKLNDGAVFGEMALLSRAPRSATVRAVTGVDVLQLGREALEHRAAELDSVRRALHHFTRSRLLNNLMAMSPLFRILPHDQRHALLDRFISTEMKPGQVLVEEGRKGIGLFVVLRGEVEIKKRDGEMLVPLALLHEGDVFGEISLVKDVPTTATVIAASEGELLFLSRSEFEARVRLQPDLWRTLSALSDERLRETRRLMQETGFLSDDEFVLV